MWLATLLVIVQPAISEHIAEGNLVTEISQATEAITGLDQTISNPAVPPEVRTNAESVRAGRVEAISSIAASAPRSAPVNLAAASSLLSVREPLRAEEAATRALVVDPQRLDGYLLRARSRMEQGRYEDAVSDYKKALELRPGDPAATAGLRLTEGRTRTPSSNTIPKQIAPVPQSVAEKSLEPAVAESKEAKRTRAQAQAVILYNEAQAAQSAKDWKTAFEKVDRAMSLSPESDFLRKYRAELEKAQREAQQPVATNPVGNSDSHAERIGGGNFLGGMFHYAGRSQKPRRVDFNSMDTSDVQVTDFPGVAAELRKPARNETVKISSALSWKAHGSEWLLMGRLTLLLRGELKLSDDCKWTFEGALRSFDDKYDFDASNRGALGEGLTALGRLIPGKRYDLEVRGAKIMRAHGIKETCP